MGYLAILQPGGWRHVQLWGVVLRQNQSSLNWTPKFQIIQQSSVNLIETNWKVSYDIHFIRFDFILFFNLRSHQIWIGFVQNLTLMKSLFCFWIPQILNFSCGGAGNSWNWDLFRWLLFLRLNSNGWFETFSNELTQEAPSWERVLNSGRVTRNKEQARKYMSEILQ